MTEHHALSSHQPGDIRARDRRSLLLSLLIISVFLVVELVGGLVTNSLALLSDAAHMLTDAGAIGLALAASWLATRPASPKRTFGYYRAEVLGALLNGLALWVLVAYTLYRAVGRLGNAQSVDSLPMLTIAVLGLGANLLVMAILRRPAGSSLNVRAAFLHTMSDLLGSVGAITAGILMLSFGWYLADPIAGIAIGALVFLSSLRLLRQAFHILLEGTPPELDLQSVEAVLHRFDGVKAVHDLHAWTLTSGYNAMSAHVLVEPILTRTQRDQLLGRMRRALTQRFAIQHMTIQIEESAAGCQETHAPGCGEGHAAQEAPHQP